MEINDKQNVIIILTDDMGYGDISAYGQQIHKTPNIDKLAKEGVKLTDFYVPVPYCAPSRASLLTGRFPLRHRLINNPSPDGGIDSDTLGIHEDEILLGEILQKEGYKTKLIGKWHLGHQPKYFPTNHGFDEYYGILYSNDMRPVQLIESMDTVEYPVDQRLLTQKYTKEALDFIRHNKEKPFFLELCHAMPHKPLAASERFYTPDTPDNLYDDAIQELDWSVGEVLNELDELGLTENTIVIFMSDNGASWGGFNGGLKGMKARTWEGGTRVPFIIRGKDIPVNQTILTPAWSMDVFPTLLNLLKVEMPDRTLDGEDILDIIRGEKTTHKPIFTMRGNSVMTVRSGDWKLFLKEPRYYKGFDENYQKSWEFRKPDGKTILAPIDEQPTQVLYPGIKPLPFESFPLLFNLREDVTEMKNLAAEYPEIVRQLSVDYDEFIRSMQVME